MDFFDYDFNVTDIVLACEVPAGAGTAVHKNRASHGLAFHTGGEKIYVFGKKKRLTVTSGDIIFLPEHSDYVVTPSLPGGCYAINFKIDEPVIFDPSVIRPKNYSKTVELFSSAEKAFRTKKSGFAYKCKSDLYALIYMLFKEHRSGYFPSERKKRLLPAVEYIHNHYFEEDISVSFLAELCGIKAAYFRRCFSECYGTSPVKYVSALRLLRAKELLSQNEYSAEAVAELSGFNNIYYFYRFFKKNVGVTPNEYRKSIR